MPNDTPKPDHDSLLRRFGFEIASRPKNKPPLWRYTYLFTEDEALIFIDQKLKSAERPKK